MNSFSVKYLDLRKLLYINLALLGLSLLIGYFLYRTALGWGDSLNMFSPYPHVSMKTNLSSDTMLGYVSSWYSGMNGRWPVAFLNAVGSMFSRKLFFLPEHFPWWAMRSLSLFCCLAAPFNFLFIIKLWIRKLPLLPALLVIYALWSFSPNTYSNSITFDCLFTDRFLFVYLISVVAVLIFRKAKFEKISHLLGYSLFGFFVFFEQFLVTAPFLFLFLIVLRFRGKRNKAFYFKVATANLVTMILASLAYFLSPGQQYRNTMIGLNNIGHLGVVKLFKWYMQSANIGYTLLFKESSSWWMLHSVVLIALIVYVCVTWKNIHDAAGFKDKRERIQSLQLSAFALLFVFVFHCSLVTLLVSNYFPGYSAQYTTFFLALFLTALFLNIYLKGRELLACHPMRPFLSRGVQGAAVIGGSIFLFLTVNRVNADSKDYTRIMELGRARSVIYNDIIQIHEKTGITDFVLKNAPHWPNGGYSLEPPWGFQAYFRWAKQPNITVWLEDNYDFINRPADSKSYTIDVNLLCPSISK